MALTGTLRSSLLLRATRRDVVARPPVWFMRQAGRYMQSYRALRERYSLIELCSEPDLAAEVTMQPIRELDVDAAILFSDILLPLVPLGLELEYTEGRGPVIHNPIRDAQRIQDLPSVHVGETLGFVAQAAGATVARLGDTPLIGFAGGPFTLASYAIEGGGSRHHIRTKQFMHGEPEAWHGLLGRLATIATDLLVAQAGAGAGVVQLFDSWVGQLGPDDYREFVMPHTQTIFRALAARSIPAIHFGVGTTGILPEMRQAGGDVIGVDWRIGLDDAWRRLGDDVAIQGNLDPLVLFAPRPTIRDRVHRILRQARGRPGHIFNLGHGILPGTPIDNVRYVVDLVRDHRPDGAAA